MAIEFVNWIPLFMDYSTYVVNDVRLACSFTHTVFRPMVQYLSPGLLINNHMDEISRGKSTNLNIVPISTRLGHVLQVALEGSFDVSRTRSSDVPRT